MSVITIEGRLGAGGPDLGRMVAKELDLDFIDRLMLADIAKRVGATVTALADQERRVPTLASRFAQTIQRMLHRSAIAGMGGDPYFGPGIEQLLARPYSEMEEPPHTSAEEIDAFRQATKPAFETWAEKVGPDLITLFQDTIAAGDKPAN